MFHDAVFLSPVGNLAITIKDNLLIGIDFVTEEVQAAKTPSSLSREIIKQLERYFEKKIPRFDLPFRLSGSEFQNKVWQALQDIPYGTTKTYGDLAQELATSARAIGNACRRNPLPIVIPCHRIVARNHIGGYSGALSGKLLETKSWLLQHEGPSP